MNHLNPEHFSTIQASAWVLIFVLFFLNGMRLVTHHPAPLSTPCWAFWHPHSGVLGLILLILTVSVLAKLAALLIFALL